MDQLKVVVQFFQKHGFWVCCGLIALTGLGMWYYAVGIIAEEAQANAEKIKSTTTKIQQIRSKRLHPNDTTHREMDKRLFEYTVNVKKGWELVYEKQHKVLTWSESFDPKFHSAVDKLRPIESVPFPTPPQREIANDLRAQYRDWIRYELPKLAKNMDAEWMVKFSGQTSEATAPMGVPMGIAGGGGRTPTAVDDKSIVRWAAANQQEIYDTHFGFADKTETPSTLRVLYAQETYWVLDTITKVVKEVNGNVEARYQAAIRDVDYIRIGQSAGSVFGTVMPVGATGEGGDAQGQPSNVSQPPTGPGPAGPGPAGPSPDGTNANGDPAEGRYLDQNYEVLSAQRLRAALSGGGGGGGPAPGEVGEPQPGGGGAASSDTGLAVAKRIPVRLRVRIDEFKVSTLLAACGNSPLPLEVRQVRINRPPTEINAAAASNSSRNQGTPAGPSGAGDKDVDKSEITLELYGIVYIYNPPNPMLLQLPNQDQPAVTATGPAPVTGVVGNP